MLGRIEAADELESLLEELLDDLEELEELEDELDELEEFEEPEDPGDPDDELDELLEEPDEEPDTLDDDGLLEAESSELDPPVPPGMIPSVVIATITPLSSAPTSCIWGFW